MKKVYDYEQEVFIQNRTEGFHWVSIWKHLRLLDPEEAKNRTVKEWFNTFDELFDAVEAGKIWNAEAWHTCILKRPIVCIRRGTEHYYVTRRIFTPVCLYHNYKDASDETMSALMEGLKADEFAEYLRERDIKFSK